MRAASLAERLRGREEPLGYVSFLSALVHYGALVDSLAVIQVASPELAGRDDAVRPGPVDYVLVPRDLFYGYRWESFEGQTVPVASPEKALIDWVTWCELWGMTARLEEIEWDAFDLVAWTS
jgi:predicted transcriptional regulator of viral defense system